MLLPRPSYIVPFWAAYYTPLPKNHNRPKKELHKSPWVGSEAICDGLFLNWGYWAPWNGSPNSAKYRLQGVCGMPSYVGPLLPLKGDRSIQNLGFG